MLALGRRTADAFFAREAHALWERFTPPLRAKVGSEEGLAAFRASAEKQLGAESSIVNEQPLLGRSLVTLEQHLDPQRFFRANRHQIVNLDHVDQVEMGPGGRLVMALQGGPEIELSRRQTRIFRARMAPPALASKRPPSE